jgi:outer membrane immunogenic protein
VKKLVALAAAIVALGFVNSASAADVPTKAPILKAEPAIATNWTGFYVNGGLGYGLWAADTTTQQPTNGVCVLCSNQEQGGKGWLGVIGIGYDYQFAPRFLAGAFADYNLSSLKGTIQDQGPFLAGEIKQTSAWAAGARLGYLFTPDFLGYVNGGYSGARFSGTTMVPLVVGFPTDATTQGFTTNGWFLGGGTESSMNGLLGIFGPGWFWRNEYRYASYANRTIADTRASLGLLNSINFKPAVQTITSQVVYKLNTGGPAYQSAPPMAPANWTGFYVNAGVGYGMWAADTTTQLTGTGVCVLCGNQEQGGKGILGVVGAGYDYQLTPKIVAGVFTDFDISSLKGTIQDQGPFFAGDIKQTSAWAVGGRAGWLITPQVLSYWNIGYTSAHFSGTDLVVTFTGAPSGFTTASFTTGGWFLGGGAEVAVAPGWFWRTDYRYASYANRTLDENPGLGLSINFKPVVQTVTMQAVYKFGWPR